MRAEVFATRRSNPQSKAVHNKSDYFKQWPGCVDLFMVDLSAETRQSDDCGEIILDVV